VVLTAPRPTSNTPNFPRAGAISSGDDTRENYISFPRIAVSCSTCCSTSSVDAEIRTHSSSA
jgi:hypothetical protein